MMIINENQESLKPLTVFVVVKKFDITLRYNQSISILIIYYFRIDILLVFSVVLQKRIISFFETTRFVS